MLLNIQVFPVSFNNILGRGSIGLICNSQTITLLSWIFKGPINDGDGLDIFLRTIGTNSLVESWFHSIDPIIGVDPIFHKVCIQLNHWVLYDT